MSSKKFVVVIEPKKVPYLSEENPDKVIDEKIGRLTDQVYIDSDRKALMIIDDYAAVDQDLEYNFTWMNAGDFRGAVVIVNTELIEGWGIEYRPFNQEEAEKIRKIFMMVTGRK